MVCGALSTYLSLHSVSLQKLSWYSSVDEEGDVLSREDIMIRGFETLTFGPVPHSGATHNDWRWMNASDEEIASFVPQSHPWGVRFPLEGDEGEDIEEMEVDADQVFAPSSSINVSRRCVLLLTAVIQCVENPHESVRQSARDFMDGLARHFAFLYVSSAGARVATSGGNAASNNNNQVLHCPLLCVKLWSRSCCCSLAWSTEKIGLFLLWSPLDVCMTTDPSGLLPGCIDRGVHSHVLHPRGHSTIGAARRGSQGTSKGQGCRGGQQLVCKCQGIS